MRTVRLRLPSPALIVACLALFAALGGASYAASHISTSSITFTRATLQNGWRPFASTIFARPGYAKDSTGEVHLRGTLYDGSSNSTAFVLPKAMRPSHYMEIVVDTSDSNPPSRIVIQKDGEVIPFGPNVAGPGIYLDGVSFAAGE
jgi:hypothetical protein